MSGLLLALLAGADCPRACPAIRATSAADALLDPLRAAVAQVYADAKACPPCEDPALSQAARAIAEGASKGLPGPLVIQRAVEEGGAGDPSPRAFLVSAGSVAELASTIRERLQVLATDNVLGLGVVKSAEGFRAVLLRPQRKVTVDRLPSRVATGSTVEVRGTFLAKLSDPTLYVEAPDGSVVQVKTRSDGGQFKSSFEPTVDGRYLVEIMGRGASGPEVAYLHSLEVGSGGEDGPETVASAAGGQDDPAAVLEAINRERQRYGAGTLFPDARLSQVAQAYAQELRELGIFAHVSPRSGDLKARLKRAGYPFTSAAENLAQGPSALEAHALAANSPAHRKAMLDAAYGRCGIGLSRVINGDGRSDVLLVEVFAREGEP